MKKLWRHVLGLAAFAGSVVIEAVEFDPDEEEIVATVSPTERPAALRGLRAELSGL